ncbi:hypothetical protein M9H77_16681 [Catharanthus roseus]|uniref:Uncharacterized protein n=1 Tax=Catharanthus roseus TaxID=4058 RepID=A0ACC0B2G2_CATRO|nr:hypothetical protein M9H77_16681 [Catharanthus roseus]
MYKERGPGIKGLTRSTKPVPDIGPSASRPLLGDSGNYYICMLQPSLRDATHIIAVFLERFNGSYYTWSETLQPVRDMEWVEFQVGVHFKIHDVYGIRPTT